MLRMRWRNVLSERNVLVAILALGFLVRVGVGIGFSHVLETNKGQSIYFNLAENLAAGNGFASSKHGIVRPAAMLLPLYPFFLAVQIRLFGSQHLLPFVFSQSIVSVLTLWVVYRIGRRLFGVTAALAGSALLALHPLLIWFQVLRFYETVLTVFLASCTVLALLRVRDSEATLWRAALAGLFVGLYTLTREAGVQFMFVGAVWLSLADLGPRIRRRQALGAFVLVWMVIVLPWVGRNWHLLGTPLLATNTGNVLYRGHNPVYTQFHPNYDTDLIQYYYPQLTGITAHPWS